MKSYHQIQNSTLFQGNLRKKQYFEGWYFKMVNATRNAIFAIIPGIALNEDQSASHAFIQILDGITAQYFYYRFDLSKFKSSKRKFEISIGKNTFSLSKIKFDLKSPQNHIKGEIFHKNLTILPFHGINPGIMGFFSYFPKMECYHGIVSMNHDLSGIITNNKKRIDFSEGKGYTEKDWGKSFPKQWIWMQSNHFQVNKRSFMLSIAKIPYLQNSFTGFIAVLYNEGKFIRFSSYNLSKFRILHLSPHSCKIIIQSTKYLLQISASKPNVQYQITGMMKAPLKGEMTAKCAETMKAVINITLYKKKPMFHKKNNDYIMILKDQGLNGGLEIMGTIDDF